MNRSVPPRGTKAKPTAAKRLDGNPGKRRMPSVDEEPTPDAITQMPEPPETMGVRGQEVWRKRGPVLIDMGLLTVADLESFEAYCQNYHIMVESAIEVNEKGMTIIGERGRVRNPALAAFAQATTNLRQLAAEFGLTPSSRARISLPDDDEQSLEDLLKDAGTKEDAE